MKNILKKFFKVVIAIIILLIIIFIGYNFVVQYDGKLDKSSPMTKEDIANLVKENYKCDNYVITYKSNPMTSIDGISIPQKIYIKDGVLKAYAGDKAWQYIDFNNHETINVFSYPMAIISESANIEEMSNIHTEFLDVENDGFEYLGEKKIKDRDTIIVKLINKKYNYYRKFYIDKQTGVIINSKYYGIVAGPIVWSTQDEGMDVDFDCVTDEDVKRPNLAGYVINDMRNIE